MQFIDSTEAMQFWLENESFSGENEIVAVILV